MTQQLEDMNFTFSWQKQYFSHSLAGLICKMLFCHLKIKFISSHHVPCNILYIQNCKHDYTPNWTAQSSVTNQP